MNQRTTRAGLLAIVLSAMVGLAACGGGDTAAEAGAVEKVAQLDADFVPKELLGLEVDGEEMPSGVAEVQSSYLEAVTLYSMRRDDLLQATLQVGRFRDGVAYTEREFREGLLSQIGASRPQTVRLADDIVYLTTGLEQRLAIWFREDHLFILGTREEFDQPRTLLREALELQP